LTDWYDEALYTKWYDKGYAQRFRIDRVLFEDKSEHQEVVVFENAMYGRVLAIDGIIQTTERDEFAYHDMMVHVPIFAHGNARKVLIIGGGDGGIMREVLRHPNVEFCHMVDIDDMVVEISKKYLPTLSDGVFDNPKGHVVIDDGCKFVKQTKEKYDVVIVDSTDPIGPGAVLFTEEFYSDCRSCMTPGGIIATQSGVPFAQPDEFPTTRDRLGKIFKDSSVYLASVPTYACGFMALGWGSDDPKHRDVPLATLEERFKKAGFKPKYYTPAIHKAAFALPGWMNEALAKK
jgi:spermidine synthase